MNVHISKREHNRYCIILFTINLSISTLYSLINNDTFNLIWIGEQTLKNLKFMTM